MLVVRFVQSISDLSTVCGTARLMLCDLDLKAVPCILHMSESCCSVPVHSNTQTSCFAGLAAVHPASRKTPRQSTCGSGPSPQSMVMVRGGDDYGLAVHADRGSALLKESFTSVILIKLCCSWNCWRVLVATRQWMAGMLFEICLLQNVTQNAVCACLA